MYDELEKDIKKAKEKVLSLKTKSTKYDEFVKAGYQSAEQVKVKTAELSSKIGDYAKTIEKLDQQIAELSQTQNPTPEVEDGYVEATEILKSMQPNGAKKIVKSDGGEEIEISYKLR